MDKYSLLALAVVVALAVIVYAIKSRKYGDIDLSIPDTRRTDLLYGYYSSLDRSYEQTKDHINLFWHSNFFAEEKFIEILKGASCKVVFDLAPYISKRRDSNSHKLVFDENAEQNLEALFTRLRAAGVLHKISYLYPVDEPQLQVVSEAEHLRMIKAVKAAAAKFEELNGVRYAAIYLRKELFWNLAEHDVVGVDNYDQKSEILTRGDHARLKKSLLPGQRTMLVPGAGFGQNPTPFIAYALRNPEEVEMVVPFLWFDDPNHKDADFTGLENMPAEFKAQWIHASKIARGVDKE